MRFIVTIVDKIFILLMWLSELYNKVKDQKEWRSQETLQKESGIFEKEAESGIFEKEVKILRSAFEVNNAPGIELSLESKGPFDR